MLSSQFLSQIAYIHQLSPDQERVFILRFGAEKEYEEIAQELKTSAGACLKRMGQVYKKFGISGDTRGKESQLRHLLWQEYQQSSLQPPLTSEKQRSKTRVLLLPTDAEISFDSAQQLQQQLSVSGYQTLLIDNYERQQKKWLTRLKKQLDQTDYLLVLLSPQAAVSDSLLEEIKLAKEIQETSTSTKLEIGVIKINFDADTTLNYDLHLCLVTMPQFSWNNSENTANLYKSIIQLLETGIKTQPKFRSTATTWESSDGKPLPVAAPELPEGQVDLASPFYIQRPPIEANCQEMILQPGALIRIKAPRQMGKTSLLARILNYATNAGYRTVHLNLQLADKKVFQSLEYFLKWFCANVGYNLNLPNQLADYWDEFLGIKVNCKAYFEQYLLPEIKTPLVLGLDEVDLVFSYPDIAEDFLALLRAWHEESKRREIWKKLRLIVVHSTEVYLPMDINQSPFNVGLPIDLPEFNQTQIQDLAKLYNFNLNAENLTKLMSLVGGHPYLIRVALYHLARQEISFTELLKNATTEAGLYSDHLRRHLWNLEKYPDLINAMQEIVNTDKPIRLASELAFKLDSMGLIKFQGNQVIPRCNLYRVYFREILKNNEVTIS